MTLGGHSNPGNSFRFFASSIKQYQGERLLAQAREGLRQCKKLVKHAKSSLNNATALEEKLKKVRQ
jgi:hypothetical protein